MKLSIRDKLLLSFAFLVLIASAIQAWAFYFNGSQIKGQVESILVDKTNEAAEKIHNFISIIDLKLLTLSKIYGDRLDELAARDIKNTALETAEQIGSYLREHPTMTVKDLQNSEYFQGIAVQPVGESGYTAVTDYNTLICRFHTNPEIVDLKLETLQDKLPGFWSVMSQTQGGTAAEGFYDWEEADGSIKKKYMYIAIIDSKTADGVGLHVAATTYLDEYGLTVAALDDKEDLVNMSLITMAENPYIKKISFISRTTREIIKVDKFGLIAEDQLSFEIPTEPFNQAVSGERSLSKVYFVESLEKFYPQMDVFSPIILRQGAIIGVIKFHIDLNELWTLTAQTKLGRTGFTYIVDEEGRLIAHPDEDYLNEAPILTSRPIVDKILKGEGSKLNIQDSRYLNENDIWVVSAGKKIGGINWGIVVEQTYNEAFATYIFSQRVFYGMLAGSVVLLVIISLLLSENITRPIKELELATRLISGGKSSATVSIKSGDEIESLAKAFNLMGSEIAKREESLRAEKRQMEALLQSLVEGVVAVDYENRIFLFTETAADIVGIPAEQAIGRDIDAVLQLYNGKERWLFKEYSKQEVHIKNRIKDKGLELETVKGRVVVSLLVTEVEFEERVARGKMLTIRDITREQQLEEMKIDFVSMASHELRTPITSILGYLSILKDEASKRLTKEEQVFLERSLIAGHRLEALMENLLSVSRVEGGHLNLNLQKTNWNALISEVLNDFKDQAEHVGLELKSKLDSNLSSVFVDKLRIREVLNNLIDNALVYTKKGHVTVSTKRSVDGKSVITAIQDTGAGIPRESLPYLFTKFYRVSGILEQGSKGTGLGLYISQAIVKAHNGEIWVESDVGKGSTFYFSVPAVLEE